MNSDFQICADAAGVAETAATKALEMAIKTVGEKDLVSIALSGGSTPRGLYELLANPKEKYFSNFPWTEAHFFFADERHVPPDDINSNYRMVNDSLFSRVPLPPGNIHRIPAELADANDAARRYEIELQNFFGPGLPALDLILLGMGTDGHTASLFPGSEMLLEQDRLVVAPWIDKLKSYRITLTLRVLNNASEVDFLVSGREKAAMLKTVLEGERDPQNLPAQAISPVHGRITWLVDREAATFLNQ